MMKQSWRDLTFLHWAVAPEEVAHRMPPGVRPDTLDGVTYVGPTCSLSERQRL